MAGKTVYLVIYGDAEDTNNMHQLGKLEIYFEFPDAVQALLRHISRHPQVYARCREGASGDAWEREIDTLRTWMQEGMLGPRAREFRSSCDPVRIVPVEVASPVSFRELLPLPHLGNGSRMMSVGGNQVAVCVGSAIVDVRSDHMVAEASAETSEHLAVDGITQEDVLAGALVAQVGENRYGVTVQGRHAGFGFTPQEGEQIARSVGGMDIAIFLSDVEGIRRL